MWCPADAGILFIISTKTPWIKESCERRICGFLLSVVPADRELNGDTYSVGYTA